MGITSGAPTSATKKIMNGFIFKSIDNLETVQFRQNGYTFNKLEPYDKWSTFKSSAKKNWGVYKKITKSPKINRIALRYVNQIDIPKDGSDLTQYSSYMPDIPDKLPQAISDFFLRMVIPDEKTGNVGIVIQTIGRKPRKEKTIPFVLDIDVFRIINTEITDVDMFKMFDSLREYKNTLFMNITTKKAQKLFN